jgi:hypothetical protein
MVLTPIWLAALLASATQQGEVKIPLDDYLALVERVEAVETAAAERARNAEPAVAELTSERTSIAWEDESASITTTFEVLLRGAATGVSLPVTGLVSSARIRPEGNASLRATESGILFVSPDPGRYEIEVQSRGEVLSSRGIARLRLAPFLAPAGELEITMAEELSFHCPPAIVAEETVANGERRIRFTLPRGGTATIETRRDVAGAEASELLASAVVVTVVDLRTDGPLRHDVVLYEVSRGRLDRFELTLPDELEIERLRTDEGEAPALAIEGVVRLERLMKLDSKGYVVLTSRPSNAAEIPLEPILPAIPLRARYLATASSVAATIEPSPEAAWLRVDLEDLPGNLSDAISLDLVSAYRLDESGGRASLALHISERPPAPFRETVVTDRDSLTLLTAEGTLVHRERLTIASQASALAVRLPPGATLWSSSADDVLVRPIERGGELLIPLGFTNEKRGTVEIIAVQEQAVPSEKTRLELQLMETDAPVLAHRWQLLFPEGNRYRFRSGDLVPPEATPAPQRGAGGFALEPGARAMGMGGTSTIRGQVMDRTDAVLPGATVTLTNLDTGWSARVVADRYGSFSFVALPAGRYTLTAEIPGFETGRYEGFQLASGRMETYAIPLDIGAVAETITVTGVPPESLSKLRGGAEETFEPETLADFRQEADRLRQGLVGGVKPIPVEIPETGKLLVVTGALPPARVSIVIDVKPK